MSTIGQVTQYLEEIAPPSLQESYDNSGLITGDSNSLVTGVLISLDCTEEVLDEAIVKQANLVIVHHPIIFKGLKRLTGKNYVERTIIKAIKNDLAIYAIHTNLDKVNLGVNKKFAEKLGLRNVRILQPVKNLMKIVAFIPQSSTSAVLDEIHKTGAGSIGDYSGCSFRVTGTGAFTVGLGAKPAIGETGSTEEVVEDRVEIIMPAHLSHAVVRALKENHPYEEAAYYLSEIDNINESIGAGMIGEMDQSITTNEFLEKLKSTFNLEVIKHTKFSKNIKKVALCGGSGSFLLSTAMHQGADAFVTGDVKYHDFFDAEDRLLYCDIGHYESEVATKDLLLELLTKKFINFALHLSECVTNPIKYYK